MSQRRFRAVDGQSPTVGYAQWFEPQNPIQYTDRIRIILYNNIPSNTNVYGKDLGFRNSATLPTPATPAHMAGSTFEQSSLASVSLGEIGQAMTTPVGSPAYFSGKVYNEAAINGQILSGMTLGTDHPYVGLAGRPEFKSDPSCKGIPKEKVGTSQRNASYRLKVRDEAERFPRHLLGIFEHGFGYRLPSESPVFSTEAMVPRAPLVRDWIRLRMPTILDSDTLPMEPTRASM